jgi:integrase
MSQHNTPTNRHEVVYKNETIKREFFDYLRESKGLSEKSIDLHERKIHLWEDFSEGVDYGHFNKERVKKFKKWLKQQRTRKGHLFSPSYRYDTMRMLKVFFGWLAQQEGYRQRITATDVEYLTIALKEAQAAKQQSRREVPTMDEVAKTIEHISGATEVDRRDRALFCLNLLTGIRIGAMVSLSIRSFDPDKLIIDQSPKDGVQTKFSKQITTIFFPLKYTKAKEYFLEWYSYLVEERGFSDNDPIFPATLVKNGTNNTSFYSSGEVGKQYWKSTSSARKVFEKRFKAAGVRYYHPHSFRHLLVKEVSRLPLTEEQKKAISQNFGHENVATTFGSYGYGHIAEERQVELVAGIDWGEHKNEGVDDALREIQEVLKRKGIA